MIIVDRALAERERAGRPIRVAMIGAGFMGRGIALQIHAFTVGMKVVAVANRHLEGARRAFIGAGAPDPAIVGTVTDLDERIAAEVPAITDDPSLVARADGVDVVVEVTGTVDYAAHHVLEAIRNGKHVVLMNAELDSTVGPILKVYAEANGVVLTNADGDQPGVTMNLYRFVRGTGARPVLCGNIKGLHDPYRNPTTQAEFARRWGQNPQMVTSFADGSKISFEQAIVANATDMRVLRRGMLGPTVEVGTPVTEAAKAFPEDELVSGEAAVDYLVGAAPSPGVFVLGVHEHPTQRHYLDLYKLGPGPLYCFYTPYHLCHFEVPNTVARAAIFGDATIASHGAPSVEVVTAAKTDLEAGQTLDGIGCYTTYGLCENADVVQRESLLPLGVAEGCRLVRDIPKDAVLSYEDVEIPSGRLVDKLRSEQRAYFAQDQTPAAA